MAQHSLDFWLTLEDAPDPDNRATLDRRGNIVLSCVPNNETAHARLTKKLKAIMKQQIRSSVHGHEGLFSRNLFAGQRTPLAGVAHQNGTIRFGHDPRSSVLDANCRAHEVDNLAYHQGAVWARLLGLFALAHLRVDGDRAAARGFLAPIAHHLADHGLGSVAEIFDGDLPFTPNGCPAHAWSVAEVLRACIEIRGARR